MEVWNERARLAFLNDYEYLDDHSFIEIQYADKYYEENIQVQDFGFQDFISNLGGFIGIFLGYSMMQIPQLLSKLRNLKYISKHAE